MACAWMAAAGLPTPPEWANVRRLPDTGLASPLTTSMGRLFDAVAAMCGIRDRVSYEGQAAVELEAAADPLERAAYPMPELDARPTIVAVHDDLARGVG